ncbi:formylglycine-generating enzyme family protein [bacterium]|nr:formylglycine-generating enzyme family protein [candidate division CSSED10-310 bacterium]
MAGRLEFQGDRMGTLVLVRPGCSSPQRRWRAMLAAALCLVCQGGPAIGAQIEPRYAIADLEMTMIRVEPGEFWLGSPDGNPPPEYPGPREKEVGRDPDEGVRVVRLEKSYYLGMTEVTQAQWRAVTGETPSHFGQCGAECPVESVTWYDCIRFCNLLSRRAGLAEVYEIQGDRVVWVDGVDGYRLPTEAEWEYACRAGTGTALYNGDLSPALKTHPNLARIAWYKNNSNNAPHRVMTREPNAWGFHDMSGNVFEWCWDWMATYPEGLLIDPRGPVEGQYRIARGGSWFSYAWYCRSAYRVRYEPDFQWMDLGVRIAR